MNPAKDYYQILGILPTAEDVVVRAAFRALAQRYHPDRFKGDSEEANARMRDIIEAHTTLCDPTRRKAYDQSRSSGSSRAAGEPLDDSFEVEHFRLFAEKLQSWGYDQASIVAALRGRGASPPAAEKLAQLVAPNL